MKTLVLSLWTVGGYGFSQLLRLGSHLILAWLLTPQIFGIMALVKVVHQGMAMFSDVGIQPSIIQNKHGDEENFLNTAWTIQIIRGFCLWGCFSIIAWPYATLYARNDPAAMQLFYIIPVVGIGSAIAGFNSTALATLNRKLQLGRITLLELATQVVSLVVMVSWALVYQTVWAMVAGGLAATVFKLIVSHCILPGSHVRLCWDKQSVNELVKFGKWIFLSTLFTFLASNIDKLMFGMVLTLEELGLYSIALVFSRVALHVARRLAQTVLFPVFARHKNDPSRLVDIAIKAREVVLWAAMGVCVSFAIASPFFFRILWDERYHQAGYIAQWLTIYIWAMILLLTVDRIPLALGYSRALFVENVYRCLGIIVAVPMYYLAGLPGFILGLSMGQLFAFVYILKFIPAKQKDFIKQSLKFTMFFLGYGVPAVLIGQNIEQFETYRYAIIIGILSGLPLLVAAFQVVKYIRKS